MDIADSQFLNMEGRLTLGSGRNRVEIYEVATVHAASYLIAYVPSEKAIFMADHMGSPFRTGLPAANLNTVSMHSALVDLGIDIDKILDAHGAREFRWKEMRDSVASYAPQTCAGNRPVCM